MNEETIIDNVMSQEKPKKESVKNAENKSSKNSQATNSSSTSEKKKNEEDSKKIVGASAVAAVAGVAVGLLTPVEVFPQLSEIGDTSEALGETVNSDGEEMEIATSVDDSMSFSEAFAAARKEVGAGGLFVWHGNTYGTYYAEEWNAMSEEEKEEYWADVYDTTSRMNEEANKEDLEDELADVDIESENEGDILEEPIDGWDDDAELADVDIESENEGDILEEPIDGWDDDAGLADVDIESENEGVDILADEITGIEDEIFEGGLDENPDLDLLASNDNDSYLAIENDMDMSEFA